MTKLQLRYLRALCDDVKEQLGAFDKNLSDGEVYAEVVDLFADAKDEARKILLTEEES